MSNEITLEALLQQNAGQTIQSFVSDDRLTHTIENIRNGDSVTEELLTDLKNRQDDLNTVITERVTELENVYLFGNYETTPGVFQGYAYLKDHDEINFYFNNTTESHAVSSNVGLLTLVLEKNGNKLYESRAFEKNISVSGFDFDLMVSKNPHFTHAYVYRGVELDNEYQLVKKFEFIAISHSLLRIKVLNTEPITDTNITYNGRIGFSAPSVYVSLPASRIQVGENVDGLDSLIQTNNIDFNDRTKLITDFTQE